MEGGGRVPNELLRHILAERWHCRPSEVDEEDEDDVEIALLMHNAEQETARIREQRSRPPSP